MKKFRMILILAILSVILLNCAKDKKEDNSMYSMILLLQQIQDQCVNCSCNVAYTTNNRAGYCVDYDSTAWGVSKATLDCNTTGTNTFTNTTKCITANSLGSCAATKGTYTAGKSTIQMYSNPNGIYSKTSTASTDCTNNYGGTFTASTVTPSIRFKNSSGSTETYTLHSSYSCGAGTKVATIGTSVSNGSTTSYSDVTAGTYYISYNGGTSCSSNSYTFSNGIIWTITSGTSTYSFDTP